MKYLTYKKLEGNGMYNTSNKGIYVVLGLVVLAIIVLGIILVTRGSLVNVVGFGNEVTITALDNAVEMTSSSVGR